MCYHPNIVPGPSISGFMKSLALDINCIQHHHVLLEYNIYIDFRNFQMKYVKCIAIFYLCNGRHLDQIKRFLF